MERDQMTLSTVRKVLAFSGVMMFCAGLLPEVAAMAATGTRELPAPTGKLSVGRVAFFWTDDSRPELQTEDKDDHRELRVDLWYPAEPHEGAAPAPYFPDLRTLGKQLGVESILLGSITGHTFAAPPIVPGAARYPVLVLSPGYGSIGILYTGLVEELVSYGYVAATVDHPFQSRAIAYPDGRIVTAVPAGSLPSTNPQARELDYQARIDVLAADLRFVLDRLTRLDASETETQFGGRLDLARVAVVGHSIGGIAAAKAALADTRFKAVVNLDGHEQGLPLILDDKGHGPRQPFIEITDGIVSPTDKQLAAWKMSRAQFEVGMAAITKRSNELMNGIDGGSFRVTAPGIRHGSFSDMAIWDSDSLEARHRRIQIVRDYSRASLDKVLRNDEHTLIDSDASPYAEVTVERFGPAR
jgi:predicted dienelactone hydrolase